MRDLGITASQFKARSPAFAPANPIACLDEIRWAILRRTMGMPLLRRAYTVRRYRVFTFFFLSMIFNLALALFAPLWALLLGPLILGVPHLLADLRYAPKSSPSMISIFGSLFVVMALLRLFMPRTWAAWDILPPNAPELCGALLIGGGLAVFSKTSWLRRLGAAGILAALFFCSWTYPLVTVGAMVLLHNFIAFGFWIAGAPSWADRRWAIFALVLFSTLTLLILTGYFDVFTLHRPSVIIGGKLSELGIGQMIFPSLDMDWWPRAVTAYAFGQGVHYFVWLKAIPEQQVSSEKAWSFAQSMRWLRRDVGRGWLYGVGLAGGGLLAAGLLITFPAARLIYLAGAAFHGYFEIAGLAFVKPAR